MPLQNLTPEPDKISLLNAVSVVGIANFLIFGYINYQSGSTTSAYFEWSLAVAGLFNILYLYRTKDTGLPASIVLFLITLALIYLLIDGGIAGTGIFWFFTFPALAFFLKGNRAGWTWFAILLFIVGLILLLQSASVLTLPYSFITVRQLIASLVTVAVLIYFYQSIIEHHENQLQLDLEEISQKNAVLEKSKAITEEKARDDAFLACIGEGVVITDPNSRVTRMNQMAEEMTGYSFAEMEGKQWGIDAPIAQNEEGEKLPPAEHALTKTLHKGKPVTDTYYYARKDGKPFPVVVTAAPTTNAPTITTKTTNKIQPPIHGRPCQWVVPAFS